jgi:hypothetical protein
MKILVGCHRVDEIAGSELYHYELCRELAIQGHKINLCTQIPVDSPIASTKQYPLVTNLLEKGIVIRDIKELKPNEEFDIAVISQPHVTQYLCNVYKDLPKVSIIHSPYRSEEIIKHPSIKHYIAVDMFVYKHLKNVIKLPSSNISLIFNGVDPSKFNKNNRGKLERTTGLYIGGWNDPLRNKMFNHIVKECNKNDWDLYVVGGRVRGVGYPPNIKFFDGIYNTEIFTKVVDFTVGLGGRTLIEGWMCGIPGYIYKVTPSGEIVEVTIKYPPKTSRFHIQNIVKQHIKLYTNILENNL